MEDWRLKMGERGNWRWQIIATNVINLSSFPIWRVQLFEQGLDTRWLVSLNSCLGYVEIAFGTPRERGEGQLLKSKRVRSESKYKNLKEEKLAEW